MIKALNRLFLATAVFGLSLSYNKVNAQAGTTEGLEFYVGFMINGAAQNPNNNSVFVSSKVNTSGVIEIVGTNYRVPFDVIANSTKVFEIPSEYKPTAQELKERIGIKITTDDPVSVYAYNENVATSDGTMVLPVNSLGENYIIHAYNNDAFQVGVTQNQMLLVANSDTTIYEVVPSVDMLDTQGSVVHSAGLAFRDTLHLGQQIAYSANDNLSGTTVDVINNDPNIFCKSIAVFTGHVSTLVDFCESADHLFDQVYPTGEWGKEYVVVPFETRSRGDVVQILAAEDNTIITTTNGNNTLDRGERWTFKTENPIFIEASKQISVMQLSTGKECDSDIRGDLVADPFMIMLSPSNQIIKDVVFHVASSDRTERYFVSLVTPTAGLDVNLNGVDISSQFSPVPGKPELSYANVPTNPGARRLMAAEGVVAHLYAFGNSESFGYAVGGNLGDFEVEIIDEQFGPVQNSVCEASELTLRVTSDIQILKDTYKNFRWEISDGTILFGDEVKHNFEDAGEYVIDMIASKETSQCSNLIVRKILNVIEDGLEGITGPGSVCPNAQDISYQVEGEVPGYVYEWFVDGGVIDGSKFGTSVRIDWDISDPDARVRALARSPEGCLSDTLNFDIVLNETLEPLAPVGPTQLCPDDISAIRYSTPQATGSTYTWEADGGTVISGQGTNSVEVNWSGVGEHRLRFTERTTVNVLCDGVSQDLVIRVFEPLSIVSAIVPVSCFGEEDGDAEIMVSGGLGPYNISWDVGVSGSEITDFGADTYRVTVRDVLGCELVEEVIISGPLLLQATVTPRDAICNGERGDATVSVTGGTAPYTFNWSNGESNRTGFVDNLSKGDYFVQVLDRNGCETVLNFRIEEPARLEAAFTETKACPEASDGSLLLTVSGGTEPYSFIWEARAGDTDNEINELSQGNYEVTIVDAAGCQLGLTGTVTNIKPLVNFPTAFSPNRDGVNDSFGAVFNCALNFEMTIYSKWGEVVYRNNDINAAWDGTFKGERVPQGVYSYLATYTTNFNGSTFTENVSGTVKVVY